MNHAVVTAAGVGSRFGSLKSLHLLRGRPLLIWAIQPFETNDRISDIVVTYPMELEEGEYRKACEEAGFRKVRFVRGGRTRSESVRCAVEPLPAQGIVLIHDAARPLISDRMIDRLLEASTSSGAVIPALSIQETVKEAEANQVIRTIPRERLFVAQTPQAFTLEVIHNSYAKAGSFEFTDEAAMVEKAGYSVLIIPGERRNLKITEPADLLLAEFYLHQSEGT